MLSEKKIVYLFVNRVRCLSLAISKVANSNSENCGHGNGISGISRLQFFLASNVSMKYIELALRRNKISQRRRQRPSRPWGRAARDGHEGPPLGARGSSRSQGGTLAISCFSRTAELNICRGETRVTSQFVAISRGIAGYPRANDTVALLEYPRARSNIPRRRPISTFFSCYSVAAFG